MASRPEQRSISADDGAVRNSKIRNSKIRKSKVLKVEGHGAGTWFHSRESLAEFDLARQGEAVLRWVACESCAELLGIA